MKDFYPNQSSTAPPATRLRSPKQLNDYKWQRAIFLYDEWQQSSFAKRSRRSPLLTSRTQSQPARPATCSKSRLRSPEPRSKEGKLASTSLARRQYHHVAVLQLQHADAEDSRLPAQQRLQYQRIQSRKKLAARHDRASLGTRSPSALLQAIRSTASIIIQNKGIAHSHVPEQRDMYESWVEFESERYHWPCIIRIQSDS